MFHQPIFYPVLNEEYATEIASNWNTKDAISDFIGNSHIIGEIQVSKTFYGDKYQGKTIEELLGNR